KPLSPFHLACKSLDSIEPQSLPACRPANM
ncbi:uncharacterized protein METZ01_LOCUS219077, partial [marine metagenome]